jgi:hypothetical protein
MNNVSVNVDTLNNACKSLQRAAIYGKGAEQKCADLWNLVDSLEQKGVLKRDEGNGNPRSLVMSFVDDLCSNVGDETTGDTEIPHDIRYSIAAAREALSCKTSPERDELIAKHMAEEYWSRL